MHVRVCVCSSPELNLKENVRYKNSGVDKMATINHFYPKARLFVRAFALTVKRDISLLT